MFSFSNLKKKLVLTILLILIIPCFMAFCIGTKNQLKKDYALNRLKLYPSIGLVIISSSLLNGYLVTILSIFLRYPPIDISPKKVFLEGAKTSFKIMVFMSLCQLAGLNSMFFKPQVINRRNDFRDFQN